MSQNTTSLTINCINFRGLDICALLISSVGNNGKGFHWQNPINGEWNQLQFNHAVFIDMPFRCLNCEEMAYIYQVEPHYVTLCLFYKIYWFKS